MSEPTRPAMTMREIRDRLGHTRPDTTDQQPETAPADRRVRYAAAIREADGWVLDDGQHMVDAVMAVADAEQQELRAELDKLIRWHKEDGAQAAKMRTTITRLRAERAELIRQRDQIAMDTIKALPAPVDRAAALREAADFVRDAHFRDGMSVQEIGTALRHMADGAQQGTDDEAEAPPYPTRHRWIAQELEGGDEWMQLASSVNRDYVEGRITSYQTRSPHGLTTRLVRETTTYTVEPDADQPDTETEAAK